MRRYSEVESILREEDISQLFERAGLHPSFNYIAVIKYSGKMELKGERGLFQLDSRLPFLIARESWQQKLEASS